MFSYNCPLFGTVSWLVFFVIICWSRLGGCCTCGLVCSITAAPEPVWGLTFLSSANKVSTGPTCQFLYVCVLGFPVFFFQGFLCLNDQSHIAWFTLWVARGPGVNILQNSWRILGEKFAYFGIWGRVRWNSTPRVLSRFARGNVKYWEGKLSHSEGKSKSQC